MDSQNKRERKQTGMTYKRMQALEQLKQDKKSGKSNLDMLLNRNDKNSENEISSSEDKNDFVVDDDGNPVEYGEEENYDYKEELEESKPINKYLKNMSRGKKVEKVNKVDEKLFKQKEKNINNLLNQIDNDSGDEDVEMKDETQNNKYNNYNNMKMGEQEEELKNYKPAYSKPRIIEKEMEIEKIYESKSENKKLNIKRKAKDSKNVSNINIVEQQQNDNNLSYTKFNPIKRTIKENYTLNESNTIKYSTNIKYNNNFTANKQINKNVKLPIEKDGSLYFYWYDAIDEQINNKPNVIFFGKVYDNVTKNYYSISVIVKDIQRTVFALPKPEYEEKMKEVYDDFERLRKNKFSYIKETQTKCVEKKYCFELPVDSEKTHKVLKIKYKSEFGIIPPNLNAETIDYIFGKKSSLLENILIKQKIKGPCWLKIKNFEQNNINFQRTWSHFEISLSNFKNIQILENKDNKLNEIYTVTPPLKIVSISTQTFNNENYNSSTNKNNELFCISLAYYEGYHVEDEKGINKVDNFTPMIFIRKINQTGKANSNYQMYTNLLNVQKLKKAIKTENIFISESERDLLMEFINKINMIDPDIFVGHNLNSKHLETILTRISENKTPNWSKIGNLKKNQLPSYIRNVNNMEHCHTCVAGRLLCDTFDSVRELISKQTNYDLRNICENNLKMKKLPEIDVNQIINNLSNSNQSDNENTIAQIFSITIDEAYYSLILMDKYQILPLTLQLTKISGSLWIKSFQCSRAGRNEIMLLHKFYENNYLYPDKNHTKEIEEQKDEELENQEQMDDDENPNENEVQLKSKQTGRRKPQYLGGLVLEPHPGLYDDIILVMDFNSLYPSIIQEYNISFETVIRKATQSFEEEEKNIYEKTAKKKVQKTNKKENKKDKKKEEIQEENKEEENKSEDEISVINEDNLEKVEIDDKIRYKAPSAILPSILKYLVNSRKEVKNLLKNEKDPFKKTLLDIKQKALKVTANSLYGYLGYKNSRFHAKDIAALVTGTGRRILKNAANIVTKLGYTIIYGDTDSVMVNTKTKDVLESVEIGKKLRDAISKQYKLLVMDIDGVFKTMLLLKKKKYACLKYEAPYTLNSKVERELKGVDLVRRDWCPLSKNAGFAILDIILSGKSKDEIIEGILDQLRTINQKIDANEFTLSDYAITKQLAKNIDDYGDNKALPHVRVAKRLKEKRIQNYQINSFIPYIICLPEDENIKIKTIADRVYHPKEFEFNKNLKIDYEWYKENQIIPVVRRLITHIQEITLSNLCDCLGVTNRHFLVGNTDINQEIFENQNGEEKENKDIYYFESKVGVTFKCFICNNIYKIKKVAEFLDKPQKITQCPLCNEINNNMKIYENVIKYSIKNLFFLYYKNKSVCLKCNENSALFFRGKCPDTHCNGNLKEEYDQIEIQKEFRFIKMIIDELKKVSDGSNSLNSLENDFNKVYSSIEFNKVDISQLWSFLK